MTITEWLSAQKKLLEAATKGPWEMTAPELSKYALDELEKDDGECTSGNKSVLKSWDYEGYSSGIYVRPGDVAFIASVRTEHARALKIIEKCREALNSIPILDTDIESETIRSEALAYFPSDEEEKHNAAMDEISDKWGVSET